jgi:integrase
MSKQKTKQEQVNQQPQDIGKINITNIMLWMMKNAYEQSTIKKTAKLLRHLERNCNTSNPEEVKLYVAKKTCSNAHKENLIEAYAIVIKSLSLTWNQPFYQRYDKKRKAPKEEHIDFIINHCRMEMATKLSISKDLGQRPIELTWLTIKDIDLTTGIVSITGAKHTIGREGKLRAKSLELLKIFIQKKNLSANNHIYNSSSDNLSNDYRHTRNRIAEDYNMPELKQIQLYDFRRFKASKEYKLSRHNFLWVKQILGHKDSRSTEKYISLFDDKNITWIPVICHNQTEIEQAIKNDCELVCQAEGITYFKKPA